MNNAIVENEFCEFLVEEVIERLKGSHPHYSRLILLNQYPHRYIILGSLAPKIIRGSNDSSELEMFESEEVRKTIISDRVKSISFLLNSNEVNLKLKVSFYVFFRTVPTLEEQVLFLRGYEGPIKDFIGDFRTEITNPEHEYQIAQVWQRKLVVIEKDLKLNLNGLIQDPLVISLKEDAIRALKEGGETIKVPKISKKSFVGIEALESKEKFEEEISRYSTEITVDELVNDFLNVYLYINCENYEQNGQVFKKIRIVIVNNTIYDKKRHKNIYLDPAIFDCNITVLLSDDIFPFKVRSPSGEIIEIPVRANNCSAEYTKNSEFSLIETQNFLRYDEPRIRPRTSPPDKPDIFPKFSVLSDLDNGGFEILEAIYDSLRGYYLTLAQERPELKDHIYDFIKKYNEGLTLLTNDTNAKKAFELMNKVFDHYSKDDFDSWRLFQIVFIICNLPDVVTMKDLDSVDLLNVFTGGGKTEAYFGLCMFAAFYDRLIGRDFGTTAIIKFPLRMLSIQQLQRLTHILISGNYIKNHENIGGEDFSLGFFVGKSAEFPGSSLLIIRRLKPNTPGKFIDSCPLCNSKVYLTYDHQSLAIYHTCSNDSCFLSKGLAIHYTQQEIYRFMPTFIVSTVDKMGSIAYNRRFRGLIGGKVRRCRKGHGFFPDGDKCTVSIIKGKEKIMCNDRGEEVSLPNTFGPRLMIQDELHLIREGFGSIVSHFETLIETMKERFTGSRLKYLCTTATIAGADNQVFNLYLKKLRVIPPESGYDISKFFFESVKEDDRQIVGRYVLGLRPNLRDNQYATLLTLRYIIQVILSAMLKPSEIAQRLDISEEDLRQLLKNYMSYLTYHNKKSDVQSTAFYLRDVVESKFYYNPSLEIRRLLLRKTLTGDNTTEQVKEVVNELIDFEKLKEPRIFVTSATNIVSHGVDIKWWNIMLFQGMPRNTAEYIQALSRVGRSSSGIVFVWYYPNRVRDLDFYKNFKIYHPVLYKHVEPVPITRWSKLALDQTIPSVFSASIINYLSELKKKPIYSDSHFIRYLINEESSEEDVDRNFRTILDFIEKAYMRDFEDWQSQALTMLIPKKVEELRKNVYNQARYRSENFFPRHLRLLYGLRGIQDMISLEYDSDTSVFIRRNSGR
ncbi:helicase-related protein [Archaeoglobus neptunius]|uniref:helicase-related protein n=1 Tax=Archaeoglobus neptunius TaxID=2798580 RepID=UPI0019265054|nr:helicase-related protein [Archaeoglobus neptunius]